jgi:hypothetical protein
MEGKVDFALKRLLLIPASLYNYSVWKDGAYYMKRAALSIIRKVTDSSTQVICSFRCNYSKSNLQIIITTNLTY